MGLHTVLYCSNVKQIVLNGQNYLFTEQIMWVATFLHQHLPESLLITDKLTLNIEMVSGSFFVPPLSLILSQILLSSCSGSASGHADLLPWTSFTSRHLPGVTFLPYWSTQNGHS